MVLPLLFAVAVTALVALAAFTVHQHRAFARERSASEAALFRAHDIELELRKEIFVLIDKPLEVPAGHAEEPTDPFQGLHHEWGEDLVEDLDGEPV